ncbi:hypothetical protein Scep_010981 [Stephania cephalantha]|uniref:Uncharacterized protein n=1 Tax=Stephania cephalantha TaxID=152367 RepID=A0AAP0JYF5_9MAGN
MTGKSRDKRGSLFCDELNTSEDGDYCGSDEGTSEESSDDDTDDEGVDAHHVDDAMIRYTLNRVIADRMSH